MIGGFIITGNSSKSVLLRALGPSLSALGLTDTLADPLLELRASNGALLRINDNWKDDQRSLIEGTLYQPTNDLESVIVATLQPGAYTGILSGRNQTAGIALLEIYDTDGAALAELANISTRGFVQSGNNVMIGGFILGHTAGTARVAVRGLGPSLADFGLNNVLADPVLELHNADGTLLVSNDNWTDDPVSAADLFVNGLAPSKTAESGIVRSLPPGAFTAILAGKNGGVGIGLVEVYNLR
jgi:hypothetical protein